jgi:hypothetical protein
MTSSIENRKSAFENQGELSLPDPSPIPSEQREQLRAHLEIMGWQTRKQLCLALGWSERQVRDVAESMGADIVRGQSGFKLTSQITRDDLPQALQSADAFVSQGTKMIHYALKLKSRLHALIK